MKFFVAVGGGTSNRWLDIGGVQTTIQIQEF